MKLVLNDKNILVFSLSINRGNRRIILPIKIEAFPIYESRVSYFLNNGLERSHRDIFRNFDRKISVFNTRLQRDLYKV